MEYMIAVCKFPPVDTGTHVGRGSNTYEYLIPVDTPKEHGFAVITRADNAKKVTADNMRVVAITETKPLMDREFDGKLKHVVATFSTDGYAGLVERQRKKESLMVLMQARLEEASRLAAFEALSEKDPELKKLVDEFKKL